ncbi:MAG: tetratricopeptide repeat protein [Gammaproteobacteria bacterium]|nr:tetratricopeptide repeat protein [Gammaproteobacteria bacterium]
MTQLNDIRGIPTTVSNQKALDLYEKALVQLHSYKGDPVETVDEAIAEDPGFVMAHCLRAHCGSAMADGEFSEHLRESLAGAEAVADHGNDREKKHVAAIRAWLDGNFKESVDILESILIGCPLDILALQIAHLSDFYLGDANNLRDRVARVLTAYDEATPGYGYLLGMYAFGLEECNEYSRAEEVGHQALEISAGDVWAIHAVAHVLEMQGRQQEGIHLYESRETDWAPDNGFAVHNWWHLALFYLDLQNYDRVLEIYDASIADGTVALEMLDASALLWRLKLMEVDVGDRWVNLADKWEETIPNTGFYPFNDCHAIMSFIGAGRDAAAKEMMDRLNRYAEGDNMSAWMVREVGLPLANALTAYGRGDYAETAGLLADIRYTANRFGGSHAQRDLISQTLIEAAIRANQLNFARALLSERARRKDTAALTWQNTARVLEGLRLQEEADNAHRRASALLN